MFSRVLVSALSVIGAFSHGCASACAGLSRRLASVTSSFEIRSFALRVQCITLSQRETCRTQPLCMTRLADLRRALTAQRCSG